ncbi:MAG: CBU_0592 family membrane protein [Sphingopyxis sp.]|uniref:CBU_0592 family membrane protein n=1 Tax=Sphingopyxis sp. TaxID=1908224 RepID=UPI003D6C8BBA
MSMFNIGIEAIGWAAAALILAAYILLSLGRLEPRGYAYQWMNVIGAGGFVINSGYNGALPSAVLNVIWAAMGLFTLWSVWRARAAARSATP